MLKIICLLATMLTATAASAATPLTSIERESKDGEVSIENPFDSIYSPTLISDLGRLSMYVGGWQNIVQEWGWPTNYPRDAIYRLDCPTPQQCGQTRRVINPAQFGFNHLNDPSIVTLSTEQGRPYLVMYMTGVVDIGDPRAGYTVENNKVYYSTSWADDGNTWSEPRLATPDLWLADAAVGPDGVVYLFGNSNANGLLLRYNMGHGGTGPAPLDGFGDVHVGDVVAIADAAGNPLNRFYLNVDVVFRPEIAKWQMLAEYVVDWTGPVTQIDFLESRDGVTFTLLRQDIAPKSAGGRRVLTPAPHPDTNCYAYYAEEPLANSFAIQVRTHDWCGGTF